MVSWPPLVANKVVFKKEATEQDIDFFWTDIVGYPTSGGRWSRPGIGSVVRTQSEGGHEVVTFSFRPDASEEQKADIRTRIDSYAPVFQYLENVSTADPVPPSPIPATENSKPKKQGIGSAPNPDR
jgi:hypothetical protein